VLACFLNFEDTFVRFGVIDVFHELMRMPEMAPFVIQRVLPAVLSIVQSHEQESFVGILADAVELTEIIIRNCPVPFDASLINEAFPALVQMMMTSLDQQALQNGSDCLRAFAANAMDQLVATAFSNGATTGLELMIQVIVRLMSPEQESGAMYAGKLVTLVIQKGGDHLTPHLEPILYAVLTKLQGTDIPTAIQDLILVFAQLINVNPSGVLDFLDAQGAVEMVFGKWVENQNYFCGRYDRNVSVAALVQVFQQRDARLMEIMVKGDEIHTAGAEIRTRSKAKARPSEYQAIPLFVKICKLLINEFGSCEEETADGEELDGDGDWEDDDEDDDEDEESAALSALSALGGMGGMGGGGKSPFAPADSFDFLSDLQDLGFGTLEETDDDPYIQDDPLYQSTVQDRQKLLADTLKAFAADGAAAAQFMPMLTPIEQAAAGRAIAS